MEKILEINDVCKEALIILGFFDNSIIEKIPSKILQKLSELAADSKTNYYFDIEKNLYEQDISEETKDLLALLYHSYIADENEKYELEKLWNNNEDKYKKELSEKYNLDDIFKQRESKNTITETSLNNTNTSLIEYKESFFTKFRNFILKLFNIKK